MRTVAFHNLGCKVNAYEIDIIQQKFTENGFRVVPFSQKADVYVINTCTVTSIADRKSRQMLHRAKEKNPDAIVIATGCYVQTDTEKVLSDPAVDIAVGNNLKGEIVEILKEFEAQREAASQSTGTAVCVKKDLRDTEKPDGTAGGESEPDTVVESDRNADTHYAFNKIIDINKPCPYEDMMLTETADRTRAYIKIQDGCNQFCSYCLIPYARGRVRSRDMEDILEEIRLITKKGYEEIVLTGIHVSSYGITSPNDLSQNRLGELLTKIQEIETVKRIRLSSLEPRVVTDEFAKTIGGLSKLCPHFHLSLQSGCDATLKRMNRHYTAAEFKAGVERLRKAFKDPAITTDVIVGFPGETDGDFEESYSFCEDIGFYEMHIFKYSKRKGTVAATLPNQVSDAKKDERSDKMIALRDRLSVEYRKRHLGIEAEVLFEEEKTIDGKKYFVGHTEEYILAALPITRGESVKQGIHRVQLKESLTTEIVKSSIL